jgi:manganese/zinc/iron transport system permease protein
MDSNPYWNQDFFGTIFLLLKRALLWLFGFIPTESLVEDDVAFIALAGIGTASVLSGLFLVVKRMTLLINSLSHTILLGIVVTGLIFVSFGLSPFSTVGFFIAAVLTALLTMFSTHVLVRIFHVQSEAAVGFMFTTLFALGVLFSTLYFRNTHIGVEAVFGNLDALTHRDLRPIFFVVGINLVWMLLFFTRMRFVLFDPVFSKVTGQNAVPVLAAQMFVASLTIVGGFQSVGVVIIMAFFTLPVLIARIYAPFLKKIGVFGVLASFFAALFSVALSRDILTHYATPVSTSAIAALSLFSIYIVLGLTNLKKVDKVEHS